MNIIKRILLAPVPWFEKHTVQDGQFTDRFRRIVQVVQAISIVTLLADPILSMIRFGYPGFSHPIYYVAMFGFISVLAALVRPDMETSLDAMKHSKNRMSRAGFYVVAAGHLAIVGVAFVGALLLSLITATAPANFGSGEDAPTVGPDGQALSDDERQTLYMNDMAAPPN